MKLLDYALLSRIADLLCLDVCGLLLPAPDTMAAMAESHGAAAAPSDRVENWSAERCRAVLGHAQAWDARQDEMHAMTRARRFLDAVAPALLAQLQSVAAPETLVPRIDRSLGGVGIAIESTLPRKLRRRGEATFRVLRAGRDVVGSWQDDAAPPRALVPMFAVQFERLGELDQRLALGFADALAESLLRGQAEIPGFAAAVQREDAALLGWSSDDAALAGAAITHPAAALDATETAAEAVAAADPFWPLWYPTLAECAAAPLRSMPVYLRRTGNGSRDGIEAPPDPRAIVADISARDQLPTSRVERELNDCLERRARQCSEARVAGDDIETLARGALPLLTRKRDDGIGDDVDRALARLSFAITRLAPDAGARALATR